jgi:hypothetical protein
VGSSDESPRNSALSAAPAAAGTDGEGGSGVDCEGSEGRNKSTLSDAVIRKLKLKNQQLDKELRDKKRHLEEMTKSVMSWKKNIKDRHVAKIEQVMRDPPHPNTLDPTPCTRTLRRTLRPIRCTSSTR